MRADTLAALRLVQGGTEARARVISALSTAGVYTGLDTLSAALGHPSTRNPESAPWRAAAVEALGQLRLEANRRWDEFEAAHG